jgi:hypothetical protein
MGRSIEVRCREKSSQLSTVKHFVPRRKYVFLSLLAIVLLFYLVDCFMAIVGGSHADLPWLERGVYVGGPFGFFGTVAVFISALWFLIFGKRK